MESAQFMGTYIALPAAEEFGLPTVTQDSLWQVWQYGPDVYWLIPFTEDGSASLDDGYTITSVVFAQGFAPVPAGSSLTHEQIYASSTDLISTLFLRTCKDRQIAAATSCTPSSLEIVSPCDGPASLLNSSHTGSIQANYSEEMPRDPNAFPAHHQQPVSKHHSTPAPFPASTQPAGIPQPIHSVATQPVSEQSSLPEQRTVSTQPATTHGITKPQPVVAYAQEAKQQEMQKSSALETAMRQEFTLLQELLHTSSREEAITDLQELVSRKLPCSWKHKYMFSEFGLALRREGLHQLALACHTQALACSPNDEHVLFNIARAEFELGQIEAAKAHLQKALEVAPEFTAAKSFQTFLAGQ